MNRITIFAFYDKNGIVDNYVISYLKYLKEISNKIVFIADCKIYNKEKISSLVCYIYDEHHGEYDFGSYKIGLQYLYNNNLLNNVDELVLCNDSCFCIMGFEDIFAKMNNCDFWGMTDCYLFNNYHLQSYFLVFKSNIIRNNEFYNWFLSVKKQQNVDDVIKSYEIKLTEFLNHLGFSSCAFIKSQNKNNDISKMPLFLIKNNCPLIKRKIFIKTNFAKESVRKTLRYIKNHNITAYNEIINYCNTNINKFLKLLIFNNINVKFFYQKKITNKNKLIIKIFKIPVFVKKRS